MKGTQAKEKGGILSIVLIIVAVLLVLGYFNIEIKDVVEKPASQSNLAYASEVAKNAAIHFYESIKEKISSVGNTENEPSETAATE